MSDCIQWHGSRWDTHWNLHGRELWFVCVITMPGKEPSEDLCSCPNPPTPSVSVTFISRSEQWHGQEQLNVAIVRKTGMDPEDA